MANPSIVLSLQASSSLSANGIVEKPGVSSLQSTTSLAVNSVLLLGGVSELLGSSRLSGTLLNLIENSDEVGFTLCIDKSRDLSLHIDKIRDFDGYIDKQKLETLYTEIKYKESLLNEDGTNSSDMYIQKQKDFNLVRER